MALSIGIVGLPNVGKSTLFNALTKNNILAANYPFATIDPNVGIAEINDPRLIQIAEISHSQKIIPSAIQFVDIAGLVEGAATGAGLGNKFLGHIREVDMIAQVVRVFEDKDVIHVKDKLDVLEDMKTIQTELILADLELIDKKLAKLQIDVKKDKLLISELELLKQARSILDQGKIIQDEELKDSLKSYNLFSSKPWLIIFNLDENQIANLDLQDRLKNEITYPHIIFVSAKLEDQVKDLDLSEQEELINLAGVKESGLDQIRKKCFEMLGLIAFFTSGEKESRSWTINSGSNAQSAASKIHNDIAKHFIKAEVVDLANFVQYNGWVGAKNAGKVRFESKEYLVNDGDVIIFHHNA